MEVIARNNEKIEILRISTKRKSVSMTIVPRVSKNKSREFSSKEKMKENLREISKEIKGFVKGKNKKNLFDSRVQNVIDKYNKRQPKTWSEEKKSILDFGFKPESNDKNLGIKKKDLYERVN